MMKQILLMVMCICAVSGFEVDMSEKHNYRTEGNLLNSPLRIWPNRLVGMDAGSKLTAKFQMQYIGTQANFHAQLFMGFVVYATKYEKEIIDLIHPKLPGSIPKNFCDLYRTNATLNVALLAEYEAAGKIFVMAGPDSRDGQAWKVNTAIDLPHKGLYVESVFMCDNSLGDYRPVKAVVKGSGLLVWESPTGLLTFKGWGEYQFHLWNVIVLVGILVAWVGFGIYKRSVWGILHYILTATLVCAIAEQISMTYFYKSWNGSTEFPVAEYYAAVSMQILKKAFWCLVLILLSHGYRTIYSLRESSPVFAAVAVMTYVAVSCASFLLDPRDDDNKGAIVSGAQNTFDILVYFYVLFRVSVVIDELRKQKQTVKQKLVTRLHDLLVVYLFVIFTWTVATTAVFIHHQSNRTFLESIWQGWWVFHAFFPVLFECILLTLMIMWRPSSYSQGLLYSIQLKNDSDDEDGGPQPIGQVAAVDAEIFDGVDDANAVHPAVELSADAETGDQRGNPLEPADTSEEEETQA
eukprot:TRINITY_DN5833_c5_g1_i1.p1 TRINITY_DN5833_c5_g1~~TRINITY_DN5833_c5_g1_i1.p1  ORF type:complete len:548 (+),score=81.23 TRINITY_DN5833_c5_g1_i1:83-1645(+)